MSGSQPPSWQTSGCSSSLKPMMLSRERSSSVFFTANSGWSGVLYRMARSQVISVQSTGRSEMQRISIRKCRLVTSIIGATCSSGRRSSSWVAGDAVELVTATPGAKPSRLTVNETSDPEITVRDTMRCAGGAWVFPRAMSRRRCSRTARCRGNFGGWNQRMNLAKSFPP